MARLVGLRGGMMADNLLAVAERGPALVFAHNSHLKCGRAEWQLGPQLLAGWPAGSHVQEMLGPRYAVIGSAVGVSEAQGIGPPEAGTLEERLAATSAMAALIPTHKGQGLPASEITALPTRSVGVRESITQAYRQKQWEGRGAP